MTHVEEEREADDRFAAIRSFPGLHRALRTGLGTYFNLHGDPLRLATLNRIRISQADHNPFNVGAGVSMNRHAAANDPSKA